MTTSRFILIAAVGLALAAACLALGDVLDSPFLGVAGALLVLLVLASRAAWTWRGRGRQAALTMGALIAAILVAFIAAKLFG